MADLFKPTYTILLPADASIVTKKGQRFARFRQRGGRVVLAPLSEDGTRCTVESPKWYGKYRDADGIERKQPLYTDRTASEQQLAELVRQAERKQAGLVDPFEPHRERLLSDHLDDFRRHLESKGNSTTHVDLTHARVKSLLAGLPVRPHGRPVGIPRGRLAERATRRRHGHHDQQPLSHGHQGILPLAGEGPADG
jgi:hypothetical protein